MSKDPKDLKRTFDPAGPAGADATIATPPCADAPVEDAVTPTDEGADITLTDEEVAGKLLAALTATLEGAKLILEVEAAEAIGPKPMIAKELLKVAARLMVAGTRLRDGDMVDTHDRQDVDTALARVIRTAQDARNAVGALGKKKKKVLGDTLAPAEDA